MSYYFAKTLHCGFDDAVERVTAALKEAGFGIITEIDVRETFKKKRPPWRWRAPRPASSPARRLAQKARPDGQAILSP